MTIDELIKALEKIDDKKTEIVFKCETCGKIKEIYNVREFGFIQRGEAKWTN